VALNDFKANKGRHPDSSWPGNTRSKQTPVVLEKDALKQLNVQVGDQLVFELPDGHHRNHAGGRPRSRTRPRARCDFLAPPFGYISMTTLENFQEPDLYNRIYATVSQGQMMPQASARSRAM